MAHTTAPGTPEPSGQLWAETTCFPKGRQDGLRAIPESLGVCRLPPVITAFHQRYPSVRLQLTTCAHEGLEEDLRRGITDLAFLLTESVSAADLEIEALGFESIVMVAHPRHDLLRRRRVRTRDLERETLLVSRVDCSYLNTVRRSIAEEKVAVDRLVEFSSVAVLKKCAEAGLGLAVLPEVNVRAEVEAGRLAIVPWDEGAFQVAILMLWYRQRWLSPTVRAFMGLVRASFVPGKAM